MLFISKTTGANSGSSNYTGNETSVNLNSNPINSVTVKANWAQNYIVNFDHTGSQQTLNIPYSGYYKFEVWGAQGGNTTYVASGKNYSSTGGYGGYSVGVVKLTKSNTIYINVGGQGIGVSQTNGNCSYSKTTAGYNGGSFAQCSPSNSSHASGGGTTHIASVSGELKNLSSYRNTGGTNKSKEIFIVAGAGGGASSHVTDGVQYSGAGGAGGGYIGNNSGNTTTQCTYCYFWGKGGTQDSGGVPVYVTGSPNYNVNQSAGSFGQGGNVVSSNTTGYYYYYSGGGSGWFGGSAAAHNAAAGGSGYIASSNLISGGGITKQMFMYSTGCTSSSDTQTKTTCTSNTGHAQENKANTGNGYARITYLGTSI